jgi:uncharacterized protein YecT (DUF1311 family)
MRRLLAAAAVALLAVPAAAQVTPGADCAALKNPGEAARCYDRLKAAAQAELDETERKIAAKLADPKAKAAYQAAAKAWAEYRDKECAFETGGAGGTGLSICLIDKTGSRVEELARQLDCPAGDPTCVH